MISLSTLDRLEIRVDELLEHCQELKALNAELLAALIQMENWASLYEDSFSLFSGQKQVRQSRCQREIEQARAVIAKAKELE